MDCQCNVRPAVTFSAVEHHYLLSGTKLYCLMTRAHGYEPRNIVQLICSYYVVIDCWCSCYCFVLLKQIGSDFSGCCRVFEEIAVYCETYSNFIPVAFILGFYVSLVVSRYWEQLNLLPWPHRLATFASSLVQGNDNHGRLLRRTILRYANMAYVLTMRSICFPVKKRFPSLERITESGTAVLRQMRINDW